MPTYEYRREDGTTFEVFQKITDDPLEVCPETGQPVERLISGGQPPIFKGSGFYETDYKKDGGVGSGGEDGSADGDSSGSTDAAGSSAEGSESSTDSEDGD